MYRTVSQTSSLPPRTTLVDGFPACRSNSPKGSRAIGTGYEATAQRIGQTGETQREFPGQDMTGPFDRSTDMNLSERQPHAFIPQNP